MSLEIFFRHMYLVRRCYAIVPDRGSYRPQEGVKAVRLCRKLDTARTLAQRWSKSNRMDGRYRVVESDGRRHWNGSELDRIPDASDGREE